MNMIDIRNVSGVYPGSGEGQVLHEVSFAVDAGARVALIGANGAGKSTLLLTLAGILTPHEGTITINGITLTKKTLSAVRRAVGLIFQNPDDQLFMSTVLDDVVFGPLNYIDAANLTRAEAALRKKTVYADALSTLALLGIASLKDKMPHKLSGGEKRLAALASVLVMQPDILLMDEPSAFLDPRARRLLIAELQRLPQTLIVATHDIDMARTLCPRSIILSKGRIRADGLTTNLLSDTALLDDCGL
jgi:cobalt/nickel transport system ATP-binding protein